LLRLRLRLRRAAHSTGHRCADPPPLAACGGMRVYVTGADGFVGRRLLPRLAEAGHESIAADVADFDIRDYRDVAAALSAARPDAVIHLAALSSVALSRNEPAECFRVNYLGSLNLIRAVEAHLPRARLMLIGSADEYETTRLDAAPYSEDTGLRPGSPYARTKAAAELLGLRARTRGLDVVCVRAFNHTGDGQSDTFVASSFAKQIAEIAEGLREPRMEVGNLEAVRDFLDVEDVVGAYLRLLDPDVPADVYNIASGIPLKIQELLDTLIDLAGVDPEVGTNPNFFRPTDQLVGDASKLRAATGWRPEIPLRDTLRGLLDGWRARVKAS